MAQKPSDDKKLLEEKLDKALEEAWSKANIAVDATASQSEESEGAIRLAAEAAEYSSALFNLTYGLEDLDPEVKLVKGRNSLELVKDSIEALRRARELRQKSVVEAYSSLRTAADYLKTAYLGQVRNTAKKPR